MGNTIGYPMDGIIICLFLQVRKIVDLSAALTSPLKSVLVDAAHSVL